ncbi:MAG: hypothetical protein CL931_07920 [Deltaproteobacteria bacterium]|nr:hypothetical protein [Deltaproteobacteria bacterium]
MFLHGQSDSAVSGAARIRLARPGAPWPSRPRQRGDREAAKAGDLAAGLLARGDEAPDIAKIRGGNRLRALDAAES